ncbi:cupin domain-containing protein [Sphingosinicella microcystinivorans]|uniref:Cupin domain n=1 Tax=Sphingosinicella microcystinivorans TaxID=335406 RepID=A0AAD1G100_SPHMI|nr:cupin domain-containing protein [Sphingosinicella microcystinivorans]RKS91230.1 cupin domain [Sphingosinicella microcystinivorans]BBE34199.1 hypothetical protein SmB9_18570 [Sphingosinicella microcystinivorans]
MQPGAPTQTGAVTIDRAAEKVMYVSNVHGGNGKLGIKFFPFDGGPDPTHFLIYTIPPNASEGVHVHLEDNTNNEGVFDEYYYIISGQGMMLVGDERIEVTTGDHIHTPIGVPHGIENSSSTSTLSVFLTFIDKAPEGKRTKMR